MRCCLLLSLVACGSSSSAPPPVTPAEAPARVGESHAIVLPGGTGGVALDYLAYDPAHDRVWVPAGGTGKVDVIDAKTEQLTPIDGFPTKEVTRRGQKRMVGPSSATVGEGVVYVGNRADSAVCAIDSASLAKGTCVTLDSSPDGLQYVASTKEVWVTTPRDKSIRILDAAAMKEKTKIQLEGEPEGFAVDEGRGVFFTNYEDKDATLAIDIKTHAIAKTWQPKCGEDGPKGLAFDAAANHLIVVCPDHVETLDAGHDGALLGTLQVGGGLDAIDYAPSRHVVVAAAGGVAKVVFASLAPDGKLAEVATAATVKGARNAVASANGTAFIADGHAGAILVVPAPK
jgi:DNA-binding beta-propeller fold protein YncE